jgi:hypothetical protein
MSNVIIDMETLKESSDKLKISADEFSSCRMKVICILYASKK